MNHPTQLLVSAASIAVIMFVGSYFWSAHKRDLVAKDISVLCEHHELMLRMISSGMADPATVGPPSEHKADLLDCINKGYQLRKLKRSDLS